jgi:hypothetical protein
MSVESTQGSVQSVGSFFQSRFVKKDMRKEPFEVQSGPVISAADVVRIGESQYRQKQVIPETRDIPLFPVPVMPTEKKFCGMDLCLEMMGDVLEPPSIGPKEGETRPTGGAGGGVARKVKKVCHKAAKATVLSPKES